MTEDITVKIIRHSTKEPARYVTNSMKDARRVFDVKYTKAGVYQGVEKEGAE